MRPSYSSITPAVIHHEAQRTLQRSLNWQPYHQSVAVPQLLALLLLMAATTASLSATVRRFFGFSHQTASKAVQANLPKEMKDLVAGLVAALHDILLFSRQDRRRRWLLAIDTHFVPYYG